MPFSVDEWEADVRLGRMSTDLCLRCYIIWWKPLLSIKLGFLFLSIHATWSSNSVVSSLATAKDPSGKCLLHSEYIRPQHPNATILFLFVFFTNQLETGELIPTPIPSRNFAPHPPFSLEIPRNGWHLLPAQTDDDSRLHQRNIFHSSTCPTLSLHSNPQFLLRRTTIFTRSLALITLARPWEWNWPCIDALSHW